MREHNFCTRGYGIRIPAGLSRTRVSLDVAQVFFVPAGTLCVWTKRFGHVAASEAVSAITRPGVHSHALQSVASRVIAVLCPPSTVRICRHEWKPSTLNLYAYVYEYEGNH